MKPVAFDTDLVLAKTATIRDCCRAIRTVWPRAGSHQASLARNMVGFRNIAVLAYRRLADDVVRSLVEEHLEDLEALATRVVNVTIGAERQTDE